MNHLENVVGKDSIRHLIFMRNRWRYKPSHLMMPHGFKFLTFGPRLGNCNVPSPEDQQRAIELNAESNRVRLGLQAENGPPSARHGGAGYLRVMRSAELAKQGLNQTKDQQTRDDWSRAWSWIGALWDDTDPKTIQPEAFLSIDEKTGKATIVAFVRASGCGQTGPA